jgi:alanyl-tRNA synthetase
MVTTSAAIKQKFLDFFVEKKHLLIPGSSVVPSNDPTLLYVNSGMAPLKAYFVGAEQPPAPNLVNVQPCIRTNDIDDVGDRHHLTFFEMLGSWSIGSYFKDEAIELAFELLVDRFGLPKERLYATVFNGEGIDGVAFDEHSARAWEKVGMARDHIVPLPAADNFWGPAGVTGPCGPCTEVFLDTGEEFGELYVPGGHFDTSGRYIEIWNAGVFMEFDKDADGHLTPLPFTSVDTGSGLERMTLAMNGLRDVYEGDALAPIVKAAMELLGSTGNPERYHRVIADHMRTSVMILGAGVAPSNEGRGYIPRRLLRKSFTTALAQGHESLDLSPVVDAVITRLAGDYPHIGTGAGEIAEAIAREARDFEETLKRGRERLEQLTAEKGSLSGADVFHLFSTYGLPVEITQGLAEGMGLDFPLSEVEEAAEQHRLASSGGTLGGSNTTGEGLAAAVGHLAASEFVGYEQLDATAELLAIAVDGRLVDSISAGERALVVVDRTPFYPTGGGQITDTGEIVSGDRDATADVLDVTRVPGGQIAHLIEVKAGTFTLNEPVALSVHDERRRAVAANHSATHLLNAALRTVLGDHISQAGSLVEPERFRFDFTHPAPVSKEELASVEHLVNEWVLTDTSALIRVMPYADAISSGAVSLAGEKYGDEVRVLQFGDFSTELCGGTHVSNTSQIGSFRIVSEESVASGIRRIYAVTRLQAVERSLADTKALQEIAKTLSTSPERAADEVVKRLGSGSKKEETREAEVVGLREAEAGGKTIRIGELRGDTKQLSPQAQRLAKENQSVVLLWLVSKGRTSVAVASHDPSATSAVALLKSLMAATGGKGGGGDGFAQGAFDAEPDRDQSDVIASALASFR